MDSDFDDYDLDEDDGPKVWRVWGRKTNPATRWRGPMDMTEKGLDYQLVQSAKLGLDLIIEDLWKPISC